ncbi:PDPFL protein, partial [Thinocorus orbignyianus]|nr:PDPFL protein [Thinocorus orbignyianus]
MASVPSIGCLLAKNQYYRSKCSGSGVRNLPRSPPPPPAGSRLCRREAELPPNRGPGCLPELIDKCWWIKSFFHSEPSPLTVGRKTLSAS